MKKLLLLPVIIFPYSLCLSAAASEIFSEYIAPDVFEALFILFALATPVCNVIFMVASRNDEPHELIRAALWVKLLHIPSYVAVFAFGVFASLMIFTTLPLILMLILFDCIILILSSSISVFALVKNAKKSKTLSVAALICQFFFCADVVSLIVLRLVSKKPKASTQN